MLSAIVLNLVFHLGSRRSTGLVLEVAGRREATDAALAEVVARTAKSWKLAPEVAARARDVTEGAVHLIQDGRLADGPIKVNISADELTLEVVLEYRGDLLNLPGPRSVSEDNLIEEQPFVKGLAGFLVGVYPDRVRTRADEDRCRVALAFDL